jgi:hypothetical protein
MKAQFDIDAGIASRHVEVEFDHLIVAGWAGRDIAAIEHHIDELSALGVPRPSAIPLYYRGAVSLLDQGEHLQVVGNDTSGEVELFVFTVDGELCLTIASDHTDRKLEAHSVALSKQLCGKPLGRTAWRFRDVADHWDELVLRASIIENGTSVLYQDGTLASLRHPLDLIGGCFAGATLLPVGTGMLCGTMSAIGGIRPSTSFAMELVDPRNGRSIRHAYEIEQLPHVA